MAFKSDKQRRGFFANHKTKSQRLKDAMKHKNKKPNYNDKSNSDLTDYERNALQKSIREEKKANIDYLNRAEHSKHTRVEKKFRHIAREERTHAKEERELLN